jgi:hypothetical protein
MCETLVSNLTDDNERAPGDVPGALSLIDDSALGRSSNQLMLLMISAIRSPASVGF